MLLLLYITLGVTVDFLIFTKRNSEDGIEVWVHDENVWLSQKGMAQLFDCSTDNISLHLKNIFKSSELNPEVVVEESSATASDGKKYRTKFYNLDAIISVGYRVNSIRATQFRQWATKVLRTYTIQGYVLDKKRLENGQIFMQQQKLLWNEQIIKENIWDYRHGKMRQMGK